MWGINNVTHGVCGIVIALGAAPAPVASAVSALEPVAARTDALLGSSLAWLAAVGAVAAWGVTLIVVDIRHQRLPNALTYPVGVVAVAAAVGWAPEALWGLGWPIVYALAGAVGGGIGGGDIKLAVSLGIAVAWFGGGLAVLFAVVLASFFTVMAAAVTRRAALPHGPSMILAAAICCGVGHLMG